MYQCHLVAFPGVAWASTHDQTDAFAGISCSLIDAKTIEAGVSKQSAWGRVAKFIEGLAIP